jgi:hypothetical protein
LAATAAQAQAEEEPFASAVVKAYTKVVEEDANALAVDPPHIAQALIHTATTYNKQSKAIRATSMAWKGRIGRGLWIDAFGRDAEALRERVLSNFDRDSIHASGLCAQTANYRFGRRSALQALLDRTIEQLLHSVCWVNPGAFCFRFGLERSSNEAVSDRQRRRQTSIAQYGFSRICRDT